MRPNEINCTAVWNIFESRPQIDVKYNKVLKIYVDIA